MSVTFVPWRWACQPLHLDMRVLGTCYIYHSSICLACNVFECFYLRQPCLNAAAAKSLQSCPTLCNPIEGSPPGSPVPGILQARTLEWVAIAFSNTWKWKVKVKLLSCAWLLATPWTAAYQAPPSMGFSRQEYWSGVPLSSLVSIKVYLLKTEKLKAFSLADTGWWPQHPIQFSICPGYFNIYLNIITKSWMKVTWNGFGRPPLCMSNFWQVCAEKSCCFDMG